MMSLREPPPGKLVISIITASLDALADSLKALERRFGRVEYETSAIAVARPEEYREEMGSDPQRRLFSFQSEQRRNGLVEIKRICDRIEPQFADRVDDFLFRAVNINPGILTPDNLIMASRRDAVHHVYLGDGVYASLELIYARGIFRQLPWTNPDFTAQEAIDFFERVRQGFEIVEPV